MMTKMEKQRADSCICMLFSILGAVSFSYWQHSAASFGFSFVVLTFIGNIGWAIEYGN